MGFDDRWLVLVAAEAAARGLLAMADDQERLRMAAGHDLLQAVNFESRYRAVQGGIPLVRGRPLRRPAGNCSPHQLAQRVGDRLLPIADDHGGVHDRRSFKDEVGDDAADVDADQGVHERFRAEQASQSDHRPVGLQGGHIDRQAVGRLQRAVDNVPGAGTQQHAAEYRVQDHPFGQAVTRQVGRNRVNAQVKHQGGVQRADQKGSAAELAVPYVEGGGVRHQHGRAKRDEQVRVDDGQPTDSSGCDPVRGDEQIDCQCCQQAAQVADPTRHAHFDERRAAGARSDRKHVSTEMDKMEARMTDEAVMRAQVAKLLAGGNAHMTFEQAVADFPASAYNRRPPHVSYTPYHLLEHLRISQWDILQFVLDPDYESPEWPKGYWPSADVEADQEMWQASLDGFLADWEQLQQLANDPNVDLTAPLPHAPDYTLLRELLLAADHNAYHIGEFGILRQVMGTWPEGH
jgi:hypothetical protein